MCRRLYRAGDAAFVEDPTYFKAIRTIRDSGMSLVGVKTDEEGLMPNDLADAIARAAENGKCPRILYLVPAYSNPRGCTLSQERWIAIVDICRRAGVYVVADDPYRLLGKPETVCATHETSDIVVWLGSFSKLLHQGSDWAGLKLLRTLWVCSIRENSAAVGAFPSLPVASSRRVSAVAY